MAYDGLLFTMYADRNNLNDKIKGIKNPCVTWMEKLGSFQ